MRQRVAERVSEFVRREGQVALPAAVRAAKHAGKVFLAKFYEEYEKERRKKR